MTWIVWGCILAIVFLIAGVLMLATGGWGKGAKDSNCDDESVSKKKERSGTNGFIIFGTVVLGIIVAVWIISKIFRIEITGVIVPIK